MDVLKGGAVAAEPLMDEPGKMRFFQAVRGSRCYMEYGAGGSTVYACTVAQVPTVISVDSSGAWRDQVLAAVSSAPSKIHLQFVDLGQVGDFGRPTSRDRVEDYWRYMVAPWLVARSEQLVPDTILIDGRFRVASFLYSVLSSRPGTVILFDDYHDRPQYWAVEKFCPLRERCGRMGVFSVNVIPRGDLPELAACIAQHSTVID